MPSSISPFDLDQNLSDYTVIDVRKAHARAACGITIAGSTNRKPFLAENWAQEFIGCRVVLFCVHGHEVSQAVCGYLCDLGVDAVFLEGGFKAWREAGFETIQLENDA